MKLFVLSLVVTVSVLAGCTSGNCRQHGKQNGESAIQAPSGKTTVGDIAVKPADRVRVFKYDGSLQCNQGKAISPAEMQKQLKDIQVFSAENKQDSLMRIQQCGTPTGKANVFEIDRKDLDQAKKLGFQLWTFE